MKATKGPGTKAPQRRARYVFAGTQHGWGGEEPQTKACPRCGELLFADMDVCYGCLYDFSRDRATPGGAAGAVGMRDGAGGGAAGAPGPCGRHVREASDPLDTIELDEIDDEAPVVRMGRHRRREAPDADETADLGAAAAPRGEAAPPHSFRIVASTEEMSVRLPLPPPGLTVGRDGSNDIVLRSRSVSRSHLRLVPHEAEVEVEDCGAKNPALVRGRPLEGSARLGDGEMVVICGATLLVEDMRPDPAA